VTCNTEAFFTVRMSHFLPYTHIRLYLRPKEKYGFSCADFDGENQITNIITSVTQNFTQVGIINVQSTGANRFVAFSKACLSTSPFFKILTDSVYIFCRHFPHRILYKSGKNI
jgi:hypothetical protein